MKNQELTLADIEKADDDLANGKELSFIDKLVYNRLLKGTEELILNDVSEMHFESEKEKINFVEALSQKLTFDKKNQEILDTTT